MEKTKTIRFIWRTKKKMKRRKSIRMKTMKKFNRRTGA